MTEYRVLDTKLTMFTSAQCGPIRMLGICPHSSQTCGNTFVSMSGVIAATADVTLSNGNCTKVTHLLFLTVLVCIITGKHLWN